MTECLAICQSSVCQSVNGLRRGVCIRVRVCGALLHRVCGCALHWCIACFCLCARVRCTGAQGVLLCSALSVRVCVHDVCKCALHLCTEPAGGKCLKVECDVCGSMVNKSGLARHQQRPKCKHMASLKHEVDNSNVSTTASETSSISND